MKTFLKAVCLTAFVAVMTALAYVGSHDIIHDAKAASVPYAQSSTIARHISTTVAAGALIQTAVLDLANVSECVVYADNSGGGSTRALNADCMADDGTTVVYRATASLTTGTRGAILWGNSVGAASVPAITTVIPGGTCKKMQFALAAAGAAAGTLQVECR
jgi:hypothetical protein